MKLFGNIIKAALAIGAVAGVALLVVKYMDSIKAWLNKLCPACEIEEDSAEEVIEEVAAEEVAAEEAPTEEAPAEEIVIEEGTPVAEETDFAE